MDNERRFETALGRLASWFGRQQRVLPWRANPDPYRVWISEIMLQQTQVATVIPYFERFMKRFPTLQSLALAPEDEVLLHWAGLGYYSRARNIHRAANILLHAGSFPNTREGWLEIPGVGPYTAGAILSISMDLPEAILDANVERVLSRVRRVGAAGVETATATGVHYKRRLWRLSRIFVEKAQAMGIAPSVTNQALMELGATVCSPKSPRCELCPLSGLCRARASGEEEAFPPRKKPKEWLEVREKLHCYIDPRGCVLLRRREAGEWRAGLWDLPASEIQREAGVKLRGLTYIGEIESRHVVTRHRITRTTRVWRLGLRGCAFRAAENGTAEMRWVAPAESPVPMGSALKKTLSRIRETFPEAWPAS